MMGKGEQGCEERGGTLMAEDQQVRALVEMSRAQGVAIDASCASDLIRYLELVDAANATLNLTRVSRADGLVKNLIDSLLYVCALPRETHPTRLLDIGTGAGFPGVPLARYFGCPATLIDSVGKKVSAVREMVDTIGLSDTIRCEAVRAEDLARSEPASFDVVASRAVAEVAVLMEYAAPLLTEGGYLVLSKAPLRSEEEDHARRVEGMTGLSCVSRETRELPGDAGQRLLLTYQKTAPATISLPRRNGMATKRPLYQRRVPKMAHVSRET